MKLNKTIFAIGVITSALFVSANATAGVEDTLANICNIVKSNDKGELRKKMRTVQSNYNMRLGDYYDGISCDGESLIRTALLNEAVDTGILLVKKLPKSRLQAAGLDGVDLNAWILSKGLMDSPITEELNARL